MVNVSIYGSTMDPSWVQGRSHAKIMARNSGLARSDPAGLAVANFIKLLGSCFVAGAAAPQFRSL